MKISLKILKNLTKLDQNNEDIVQAIKEHIGEVEDHHNLENDYENIVIAEITDKKDHPDADKLGVYMLKYGETEPVQVLAGDKTLEIGDKVAYLKPGAFVPYSIYTEEKPFVIQAIKMRGLPSNGMMGSEKELNLGPDHSKVMRLSKEAPVGEAFSKYFELDDYIIDIENKALTNRGDLFGILGLARELSVVFGKTFTSPDWYTNSDTKDLCPEGNCLGLEVINDAEALCNRYCAIAVDNIKILESPLWLKSALIRFGYKPINNVVDITNYVSHLIGQPLHAFDYDKVLQKDPNGDSIAHINIRMGRQGESILGLDNKVHELNDRVIVIADSTNPIAIAGIIGGAETEVDEHTTRIIIECANFDKTSIRKTSMMLGINTDAGTKFKHAIAPEQCIATLKETIKYIKELANGTIASELVDIYTNPQEEKLISLSVEKLNEHLGLSLSIETVKQILQNLEYQITKEDEKYLTLKVPFWRKDISIKEDIHEDIGRIYGYNNIEPILPLKKIIPAHNNHIFSLKKTLRQLLSDSGANETDTYNFVSTETLNKCHLDPNSAHKVKNALAPELSLMRTSLIPSLFVKSQENIQRGFEKFALYEFNIPHLKGYLDENELPLEHWHLSLVLTSNSKEVGSAYYEVKRYLEKIVNTLKLGDIEYTLLSDSTETKLPEDIKYLSYLFDQNTTAIVSIDQNIVGIIGEPLKDVKQAFQLPVYTGALDLNINVLSTEKASTNKFKEISKYPASQIDLCFEVDRNIKYAEMEKQIEKSINTDNLSGAVSCLDIYQDPKQEEKKRITFRIDLRHYEKTLTDKDVHAITEKVSKKFANSFNAKLV